MQKSKCQIDVAGDEFRRLCDRYLRRALSKGVPPLFVDLRPLYKDEAKAKAIEELCLGYLQGLRGPKKCYDPTVRSKKETLKHFSQILLRSKGDIKTVQ